MAQENKLIILRGLPGVGKTDLAKTIKSLNPDKVEVVSLDDQFINEQGVYVFEPALININVGKMLNMLEAHMALGVEVVVLDNTHTRLREIEDAENLAIIHNYKLQVINIEFDDINILCERRSTGHKLIPRKQILHMRNRWQFKTNPKPFGWYWYRIIKFFKKLVTSDSGRNNSS